MGTQNRDRPFTRREKFPEPRGWALKWVFTPEVARSTAEQKPENGNGARGGFAEPRGWAMKWDGFALSETGTENEIE
jgi:hypothetical protein